MDQPKPFRTNRTPVSEPVNKFIKARDILVIDPEGTKRPIMGKREALELAESYGLDLYQVGMQDNGVAICKILDFGKFKYEKQKKSKEAKKHQDRTENKEIRLTVNIGDHDLQTKARKAREFLAEGNRVKVSLKFRGREVTYMEFGKKTLDRFYELVADIAKIEKEPKLNMKFLDMYIAPKK